MAGGESHQVGIAERAWSGLLARLGLLRSIK